MNKSVVWLVINGKTVACIIVAAGTSARMGFDKLQHKLNGETVLEKSISALALHELTDSLVVVCGEECEAKINTKAFAEKPYAFVRGGAERRISAKNGVEAAKADIIAIHDAARPFVSKQIITDVIINAEKTGAAAPAVCVKDTIKEASGGIIVKTPPRSKLFAVQTPQAFSRKLYISALSKLTEHAEITDDCQIMELAGYPVTLTKGEYSNRKITTPEDFYEEKRMRIGHGYDVHRLCEGRKLILGGVCIEHETGLLGHSDADVLVHAIMDALLGAAALGDIGLHFPDTCAEFKNADSIQLLKKVSALVLNSGYEIENIDATILCQAPRLRPQIDNMRANIAKVAGLQISQINVKATTEEGLGFTGAKEGIAAHAVALLKQKL